MRLCKILMLQSVQCPNEASGKELDVRVKGKNRSL